MGALIAQQGKDENGRVLPANATSGVVNWFAMDTGQGAGRVLVSQPGTGLARNFGCQTTTMLCGSSSLQNNSLALSVGNSGQMGPYNADMCTTTFGECGGSYSGTAGWGANWSSSNTSVASIPSPYDNAEVSINGNSAGSTQITASGLPMTQTDPYTGEPWSCYPSPQTGSVAVSCQRPSGETTMFSQWGDNDPLAGYQASYAGWTQTLTRPASSYANGTVQESNEAAATDSCYFSGSPYPNTGVNGSHWTVNAAGNWGPDYIGYSLAALGYYQAIRPQKLLPMPCGYTAYQKLTFQCVSGGSPAVFDQDPILQQVQVTITTESVSREGAPAQVRTF